VTALSAIALWGSTFMLSTLACATMSALDAGPPVQRHSRLSCLFWFSTGAPLLVLGTLGGTSRYLFNRGGLLDRYATANDVARMESLLASLTFFTSILMVGVVFTGCRLIIGCIRVRQMVALSTAFDDGKKTANRVETRISTEAPVPMVAGLFRPVVLLPLYLTTTHTVEQLALVVAHERAHANRRDNWRLLGESCVLIVFWWCIPLRVLHDRLIAAREDLCDEIALRDATPQQRRSYARTLLACLQSNPLIMASAFSSQRKSGLEARVTHIVNDAPRPRTWLTRAGGAASVIAAIPLVGICLFCTLIVGRPFDTSTLSRASTASDGPQRLMVQNISYHLAGVATPGRLAMLTNSAHSSRRDSAQYSSRWNSPSVVTGYPSQWAQRACDISNMQAVLDPCHLTADRIAPEHVIELETRPKVHS
jgi:hypothetical protein